MWIMDAYLTLIDIKVLNHESFLGISEIALKQIISRDSFCAAEVNKLGAVKDMKREVFCNITMPG